MSNVKGIGVWKGVTGFRSNYTNISRRTSWIIMIDIVEDLWLEEIELGWQNVDGFQLSCMNALPWYPVWSRFVSKIDRKARQVMTQKYVSRLDKTRHV